MRHVLIALIVLILFAACKSWSPVERVQAYRAAAASGAEVSRFLAPGARMWYETKQGVGEPLSKGAGAYTHWDHYFGSKATLTDWQVNGGAVSAVVHETNGFYRLLEWEPDPYRMTWWLDDKGRVREALLTSMPGGGKGRLAEFRAWAREHHPAELDYLMPNGHLDPKDDRAERFAALLREWRSAAGLPPVELTPGI